MMITGVAVVVMNLNPLIKLDGYYLFGELIGMPTLKEDSTDYLSSWVKRHVFRLPVEVAYLLPRRRWFFVIYAILSGFYSYFILFAAVRFAYNVFSHVSPQWAFLPALLLAGLILRVRLRSSMRFVKDFILDKKQSVWTFWNKPHKTIGVSIAVGLVLFAPVWRKTVGGRFVLEPEQRAVVRATVPGQISQVLADEGCLVAAGAPLFSLRNLRLETQADVARADLSSAEARAREAQLTYTNVGSARAESASQAGRSRSVLEQVAALQVASPIAGVVATPRIRDRLGSFVQEGDVVVEVDDNRNLKARIFIPEFQVQQIRAGDLVSLKLRSLFWSVRGQVNSIAPASSEIAPGLVEEEKYKGIAPPIYYVATVLVANTKGNLRSGMSGEAKVQVRRQSIAGLVWETVRQALQRKFW